LGRPTQPSLLYRFAEDCRAVKRRESSGCLKVCRGDLADRSQPLKQTGDRASFAVTLATRATIRGMTQAASAPPSRPDSRPESKPDPSMFQFTGGLLERSIYVERPADRLLPEALLAGEYCHILAPRQIGKTSLCFRTARALIRRGVRCANVDVTAAGTPSTAEEWYFGLVDEIARRLRMPDPLDEWQKRAGVAPAQRFRDFVRALVEKDPTETRLVIFLDEIEMVRLAPVDVDDFLLILRSFHEERGQSPALRRLSFCLIGVTTPNDLIKNKSVTPFNVSKAIRIDDFTREECDGLAPGLTDLDASAPALLDAVYGWTDGHPYMTMRACFELARQMGVTRGAEQAAVDEVVRGQFLDRPLEDTNLNYAARRFEDPKFERDGARLADKIQLYRRVLARQDPPAHNESAVQMELRICGMVKDVEVSPGRRVLRPRNRIYERALDTEWLRSKGERRFFSEAVWKWLDAGKDEAALLRGVVLEKAQAWAKTNPLSEDEQAFLDASQRSETQMLEDKHTRMTVEVARVETQQKEAGEELTRTREALEKARAEIAEAVASSAREQAKLKAKEKATKRLLWLAVLAITFIVVASAVVVSQLNAKLAAGRADLHALEGATRHKIDEAERARKTAEESIAETAKSRADNERANEEIQKKLVEVARQDQSLKEAEAARDKANEELKAANGRMKAALVYVSQNRDLNEKADKFERQLRACDTEKTRLMQESKRQQFATPPAKATSGPSQDPYP
jgi:hypothetical protein